MADQTIETDAVVIGAGPVGLFQVFQLGLQGLRAQVVDSLPRIGGQCALLYADKPIYDIPAVRVCTGQQLVDSMLAQIEPFSPGFHVDQEVSALQKLPDGRFALETSRGIRFLCKVVHIAAGVGAFQPRTLKLAGLERFAGTQVFHRWPADASFAGQQVVVVGNGDEALDAALRLTSAGARSVTLLHRRDEFSAEAERVQQLRQACAQRHLQFTVGQITGFEESAGRLSQVQVMHADGSTQALPADALLVLLGLSPRLGPIADWGLALERRQVVVDTARFETSVPGIFAVGDINTYPGKRKLIVSGFHEATLAAFAAAAHAHPNQPVQLQYTTTSPRLHQLLGVTAPPAAT